MVTSVSGRFVADDIEADRTVSESSSSVSNEDSDLQPFPVVIERRERSGWMQTEIHSNGKTTEGNRLGLLEEENARLVEEVRKLREQLESRSGENRKLKESVTAGSETVKCSNHAPDISESGESGVGQGGDCGDTSSVPTATTTITNVTDSPPPELPSPWRSSTRYLWPTAVEMVDITKDHQPSSPEPALFHKQIALAGYYLWVRFRKAVLPRLTKLRDTKPEHYLLGQARNSINDGFFFYQRALFEFGGDEKTALKDSSDGIDVDEGGKVKPAGGDSSGANSSGDTSSGSSSDSSSGSDTTGTKKSSWSPRSWQSLDEFAPYRRIHQYAESLSRRYLESHVGLRIRADNSTSKPSSHTKHDLKFSTFSWFGVHPDGELHAPHNHCGEYNVAVFYAYCGESGESGETENVVKDDVGKDDVVKDGGRNAGVLRLGDPRGGSAPFGKEVLLRVKNGQMVLFPSWLSHMATVSGSQRGATALTYSSSISSLNTNSGGNTLEWGDGNPKGQAMASKKKKKKCKKRNGKKSKALSEQLNNNNARKIDAVSYFESLTPDELDQIDLGTILSPALESESAVNIHSFDLRRLPRVALQFNVGPPTGSSASIAWARDPAANVILRKDAEVRLREYAAGEVGAGEESDNNANGGKVMPSTESGEKTVEEVGVDEDKHRSSSSSSVTVLSSDLRENPAVSSEVADPSSEKSEKEMSPFPWEIWEYPTDGSYLGEPFVVGA